MSTPEKSQNSENVNQCLEYPGTPCLTPKLLEGQLALCKSCGYKGQDISRCQRCKRMFTKEVEKVPAAKRKRNRKPKSGNKLNQCTESQSMRPPLPKFVERQLAVCKTCGFRGLDFSRCQRCKRVFTEEPRSIPVFKQTKLEPEKYLEHQTCKRMFAEDLKSVTKFKRKKEQEINLGNQLNQCPEPQAEALPALRKFIEGQMTKTMCKNCGYRGHDFSRCQRCKRVFAEEPKNIPNFKEIKMEPENILSIKRTGQEEDSENQEAKPNLEPVIPTHS